MANVERRGCRNSLGAGCLGANDNDDDEEAGKGQFARCYQRDDEHGFEPRQDKHILGLEPVRGSL